MADNSEHAEAVDQASDQPCAFKPETVSSSEVYRCLYTNFLHQDRLVWSRTQAIVAVEVAVQAGSYATQRNGDVGLAVASMVAGSVIIFLIWRLIVRDQNIRDHFFPKLDAVHVLNDIRLGPELKWWNRGRIIMGAIVFGLIGANVVLAIHYGWKPWTVAR